jgi:hypothetical protein
MRWAAPLACGVLPFASSCLHARFFFLPARPAGELETRLTFGREGWYPPVTLLKAATFVVPPAVPESS